MSDITWLVSIEQAFHIRVHFISCGSKNTLLSCCLLASPFAVPCTATDKERRSSLRLSYTIMSSSVQKSESLHDHFD